MARDATEHLPSSAGEVAKVCPEIWRARAQLDTACSQAGPVEGRTARLVKLALAVGALSEGAVRTLRP